MTFDQFYTEIITVSKVDAPKDHIRILWSRGYNIEQAVHYAKTMHDTE